MHCSPSRLSWHDHGMAKVSQELIATLSGDFTVVDSRSESLRKGQYCYTNSPQYPVSKYPRITGFLLFPLPPPQTLEKPTTRREAENTPSWANIVVMGLNSTRATDATTILNRCRVGGGHWIFCIRHAVWNMFSVGYLVNCIWQKKSKHYPSYHVSTRKSLLWHQLNNKILWPVTNHSEWQF